MRKQFQILSVTLLFLLQSLTVVAASSFQVPDSSFEDWSDSFNGNPAPGATWNAANIHKVALGINVYGQVAHRVGGSDAHSGNYAAKLVDTEVGAAGITEISPSWITLGTPWAYIDGLDTESATAGTDGGIKFTHRPDTMAVWIKRVSEGTENINLVYYSWRGTARGNQYLNKAGGCESTGEHVNEESDIRKQADPNKCGSYGDGEQIGEGLLRTNAQYHNWTQVKVPITYYKDQLPEMMNIILSASNYPEGRRNDGLYAGNYLIVDDLSLIYSSKIHELRLDNEPMIGFNSNVTTYTIELGEHATVEDIPDITCKRSGRSLSGSEITIVKAQQIGQPTTITVKAEDGSSTTTYTLMFVRKRSTNSRLENIFVNGVAVPSFSGYVTNYNVEVPYGSKEEPVITVAKGDEGQTIQVESCSTFPCVAKVTVTAANPEYSTVYTLNLKEGELSDNTLQDILVNGNSIPGFKPTTNVYRVELPLGTTQDPTIEAVSKYADGDQKIVVNNKGLNGTSTIVVTPPVGSARTYRISYVITESSYSYLKDIQVGGVSLVDFDPETTQYQMQLPLGTKQLPAITWTQGDPYQTVTVTDEGVDGTARITVNAQNGNTTIYRIAFSVEKSSLTTLNNILVNGVPLAGFVPDTYEYTYNVTGAVFTRPVVTWEAGDAYQVVTKNPASESTVALEGVTKLTVRAQNGNTAVYSITFTQKLSDNANLTDLQVAGYPLMPAFSPEQTEYTCRLNRGTTIVPAITFTKGDETQVVRVDENGVNGVAKITVKAQTGTTQVYSIAFSVETSSDATLKDILVGGVSVDGFNPATLEYNVTLPAGTIVLPTIEAVKNDAAQRVAIIKGGVNGTTAIKVVAEDGTEQTYLLHFSVEKSLNANLQNIYVGGEPLPNFDPDVMMYRYVLAENMSSCPIVKAEGYPGQTITTTMPKLVGTARITVQPELGSANVYTIEFVREMSANNQLKNMLVNGEEFGFDPAVNVYEYTLQENTTVVPTVSFEKAEESQTVQIISGGLNGTTQIIVLAEDGSKNVYEIHFSVVRELSAKLTNILIDGTPIENFDEATFAYTYQLPYNTKTLPQVSYESLEGQHVSMLLPMLAGDATFVVTTGDSKQASATYTVTFTVEQLEDATLANILVDNRPISGFDSEQSDYVLDYQKGSALPVITYQKKDETQQVLVVNQGLNGCTIRVTAQNGNQKEYHITYNVLNNNTALLKDIQWFNAKTNAFESVSQFDPQTYSYAVVLPWRTTTMPVIRAVESSADQTISVQEGGVNGTTVINVLADDGVTAAAYQVNFSVAQSNDATLSYIQVGESELEGFEPTKFDYQMILPYGTVALPQIAYENAMLDGKAITEQQVVITESGVNGLTTLQVTSQDKSQTNTYSILFSVAPSSKENILNSILVGTVQVPLRGDVRGYDIELPYGTTELPEVTFAKNYPEQEVKVVAEGMQYRLIVESNNPNTPQTTYYIRCTVKANSPASLKGINVKNNARLMPNFNRGTTQYVAIVTDKADIEPYCNTDSATVSYPADLQATNKIVARVTNLNDKKDVKDYTFYLHYKNDIIPNGEFNEWTTAKYNNAPKPTGWTVPADCVKDYTYYFGIVEAGTYTTGSEVQNAGSGIVKLASHDEHYSICGAVPAMMTIGNMALNLTHSGNSNSSISGGIPFRNTPDQFSFSYKYTKKEKKINNMKLGLWMADDATSIQFVDHKDSEVSNNYVTETFDLNYNLIKSPTSMNISINSTHTDNASDLGGLTNYTDHGSELYVDYLRFSYNNTIKSIMVNGKKATDVGGFVATVDTEYYGYPKIEIQGQVQDQAYAVACGIEHQGQRKVDIISYAEDGSSINYTLTVNRPLSANNKLKSLALDGVDLTFNPDVNNYTVYVPVSQRHLPDIKVVPQSMHAKVAIQSVNLFNNNSLDQQNGRSTLVVTVTSETGANNVYTVVLDKQYSNDVALKDILVGGESVIANFDAETLTYTVALPAGTTELPTVTYQKQSDKQVVTLSKGLTTTLDVVAEDGVAKQTYTIQFVVEPTSTSALLSNIWSVDESVVLEPLFAKDVFDYTCQVKDNTIPVFLYQREFDSDVLQASYDNNKVVLTLSQRSLNRSLVTNTYTINMVRQASNNALLQTILVNGQPLSMFDAQEERFEVVTQEGVVYDVEPVLAEKDQTMQVTFDKDSQTYTIVVTAADNNTSKTYQLQLKAPVNNNADLARLEVDGKSIAGFDKDNTTYSYAILYTNSTQPTPKLEEPAMPHIMAVGAGKNQTISIENNGINGKTYILVKAESGAEKTYEIDFAAQQSDYVYLKDLFVNCKHHDLFYYTKKDYTIDVPVTKERPAITYEPGDAFQVINEKEEADKHVIEVTSQSGKTLTYTVTFNKTYTKNAMLNGITLDGVLLPGFVSDDDKYDVELPVGTTVLPTIGVINGADGQTTHVVTNGVHGDAVITVTADDNETKQTYTIHFTVDKSQVNTLLDIQLDGVSIEGFDPNSYQYTHNMPVGSRVWPLVSWTAGDAYQTVEISETEIDTWNKVVTLVAKPEDEEVESKTYTINMVVEKSNVTTLKDIQLDNVSLEKYDAETTEYFIELPVGTKQYPVVTYTPGDEFQVVDEQTVGNKVTLVVTAENGSKKAYTLEFVILHSSNALLNGISVDYKPLEKFEPGVFEYWYELPWGTTQMPDVTYETGDVWQVVTTEDNGINGDYKLTVQAEDGDTEQTYVIHFSVAKSNNALLQDILVGGESMPNFDPEVLTYSYDLPYGETVIPAVEGVKTMEEQVVEVVNAASITQVTTITVTAQDGKTKQTYTVSWKNKQSSNAQLTMIYLDGVPMDGFEPGVSDYPVSLPYGTTQLPEITWQAGDADQTVTIEWQEQTAFITVEAQDGTPGEYSVSFTIEKSSENRLKDLAINGVTIEGFDPEKVEYTIVYPAGTSVEEVATIDQISYQLFDETQQVNLVSNDMVLMIQVTAQNGDMRTYVIAQSIALSSNTQLLDIMVNGKSLDDFNPEQLQYVYVLPYGSDAVPTDITYVQAEDNQVVTVAINQLGEPTELFVTAQDGSKAVYRIYFTVDDFNPATVPTDQNVCVSMMPNGLWKFTTDCNNVSLYLSTLDGKVICISKLPLVDANVPNICDVEANGYVYETNMDNIVAYYFVYNKKVVIKSGKVRISHQ